MACEAAKEWGRAPSAYIVPRDQVTPEVGVRDRTLEIAFTVYRQGLCEHCGYPREVCESEDRFEAQVKYCHATAAVEKVQQSDRKPEAGEYHISVYQEPVEI